MLLGILEEIIGVMSKFNLATLLLYVRTARAHVPLANAKGTGNGHGELRDLNSFGLDHLYQISMLRINYNFASLT